MTKKKFRKKANPFFGFAPQSLIQKESSLNKPTP
jgi:hypothetical protein